MLTDETCTIRSFIREDLNNLFEPLPKDDRIGAALDIASRMTEFAAYEMARSVDPEFVSELILIAARLDRVARSMQGDDAPMQS